MFLAFIVSAAKWIMKDELFLFDFEYDFRYVFSFKFSSNQFLLN